MRTRLPLIAAVAILASGSASAQLRLPHIAQRPQPGSPQPPGPPRLPGVPPPIGFGIDALRADFIAQSGSPNVYFGSGSTALGTPAKTTLGAQAQWLLRHPELVVRIEGYGDPVDTRDHSLALGAARAEEVRGYLVLMGVPAAQLTAVSFGKERAGAGRAVTILVR